MTRILNFLWVFLLPNYIFWNNSDFEIRMFIFLFTGAVFLYMDSFIVDGKEKDEKIKTLSESFFSGSQRYSHQFPDSLKS